MAQMHLAMRIAIVYVYHDICADIPKFRSNSSIRFIKNFYLNECECSYLLIIIPLGRYSQSHRKID